MLKKYSKEAFSQLKAGNVEFINKLVQAWIVPRTLLMAALGLFFFTIISCSGWSLPVFLADFIAYSFRCAVNWRAGSLL